MKLTDLSKSNEKLKVLQAIQIEAIHELIDLKTEDDMEKALAKMDLIKNEMINEIHAVQIEVHKARTEMAKSQSDQCWAVVCKSTIFYLENYYFNKH